MKNYIKTQICEKFVSFIPSFFRDELSKTEEKFFKAHYKNCTTCQQQYLVMQKIYQNFKKIDEKYSAITASLKHFTINEYNNFNENISAYIDKELSPKENLAIKNILIKNIYAQDSYKELNNLISVVQEDFKRYSNKIKFKEIIRNIHFYLTKFSRKS